MPINWVEGHNFKGERAAMLSQELHTISSTTSACYTVKANDHRVSGMSIGHLRSGRSRYAHYDVQWEESGQAQ